MVTSELENASPASPRARGPPHPPAPDGDVVPPARPSAPPVRFTPEQEGARRRGHRETDAPPRHRPPPANATRCTPGGTCQRRDDHYCSVQRTPEELLDADPWGIT